MIGTLRTVVLDAPDVRRLAAFYTALGGWTEQYADDDWITLETGDGWRIAVQLSPDHVPPRWPDPAYPQQAHLDLRVPDLDAGSAQAVELGAELLRTNETWYTLVGPAGHPGRQAVLPLLGLATSHVREAAVMALERHGHGCGWAVPVLGHDQVRLTSPRRLPLIKVFSVQKYYNIRILLNRAGFAQIGQ
jgi:Glyoxalase-like domain